MIEATIDTALPASAHAPQRHATQDNRPLALPIRPAPHDTPGPAPQETPDPDPAHPGLTLRDTLARHGLRPGTAATRLGLSRQRLHELTHGTRAITPATALRLEALLGEHAETWMARQSRYDIDAARRAAGP